MSITRTGLLFFLLAVGLAADTLTGTVTKVADGDLLELRADGDIHRVRLNGIDAPEKGQPFGRESRRLLSLMTLNKRVTVAYESRDEQGRILGNVSQMDGERPVPITVNILMVRKGAAWHDKKHSKDKVLAAAERQARAIKEGLWKAPNPIPPWDWRKGVREKETPSVDQVVVYVTDTGTKYHRDGCRYLTRSKHETTLARVGSASPCKVCKPPVKVR